MQEAFKGVIRSFYSRPFYYQLARKQQGIGMAYILLLTLIMTLMTSVGMLINYHGLSRVIHQLPVVVNDFPAITYKDHKLSVDKPTPYWINLLPSSNKIRVVIDPNYQITDIDALTKFMKYNGILAVVTNDKIVMLKKEGNELDITDFKDRQPFTITHDNWHTVGDVITRWGVPLLIGMMFLSLLIGACVINLVLAFLVGIVVKIASLILRAQLDFVGSIRVASAMRIPVEVITTLPVLFGLKGISGIPGWSIWLVYLVFAVWSARPQTDTPQPDAPAADESGKA